MRRRAALELAGLALAVALFLLLVPRRPVALDAGLALAAGETRRRFWGEPVEPLGTRRRRAWRQVLAGTAAALALFAAGGALATWWVTGDPGAALARVLSPALPLTLALFLPWAALQQALLQFYLLGRLRRGGPGRPLDGDGLPPDEAGPAPVYHPGRRRQPVVSEAGPGAGVGTGNRAVGIRGTLAHVLLATDGPDTAKGASRW